jgi:polyisoprenoid-binding protein YceI
MSIVTQDQAVPTGTWSLDKVHSTAAFSVRHIVSTFRAGFNDIDASLETVDGRPRLVGTVKVASVDSRDENLDAHLQSPEFFDAERHPEIRFESDRIERDGDEVVVYGDLTIKGITREVVGRGTVTGPTEDPYGNQKLGIELAAVVDRNEYGIEWNAPLPKGGNVLADDVTLAVHLELLGQEA